MGQGPSALDPHQAMVKAPTISKPSKTYLAEKKKKYAAPLPTTPILVEWTGDVKDFDGVTFEMYPAVGPCDGIHGCAALVRRSLARHRLLLRRST